MSDAVRALPKVAVIGVPLYGHVRPVEPLLRALRESGFEVHYYNTARFAGVASAAGCVFVEYDSLLEKDPYAQPCLIFLHREIPHTLKQLEKNILRERYDLLLYDSFCVWTKYLAMRHGLPAGELFTTYPNSRVRDTDPSRLIHLEYEGATLDYISCHNLSAYTVDCPARKPVPRTVGLHDLKLLDSALRSPGLDCPGELTAAKLIETPATLNLVFMPEGFVSDQPPNKPGVRYHFVASLYRLEPLKSKGVEKLIYASFGTRSTLIERLIAAWLKNPALENLRLHAVAGGEAERLRHYAGANLAIESFADQHAMLAKADVFITHGGMNGIMEAILTETPMLVIPLSLEQELTARNIQWFLLGAHCPLEKLETIDLPRVVEQLLANAAIRDNLRQWRTRILDAGGVGRAVELIKDRIASGTLG